MTANQTPAYAAEVVASRQATAAHRIVCNAYHAGKIGDAEFLASRAALQAADAAFDAAAAIEAEINPED